MFQRWALALYQRCATLKIQRRILFLFQCRINVISTFIHNAETTLIRRLNVGWVGIKWKKVFEVLPNDRVETVLLGEIKAIQIGLQGISIFKSYRFLLKLSCFYVHEESANRTQPCIENSWNSFCFEAIIDLYSRRIEPFSY